MAFSTKNTRLASVEETTAGTPVVPSAGTDFLALQEGFAFDAAFGTLQNGELNGSNGRAQAIQGLENPTGLASHYLRHSGVEGTEPNFGKWVKGFMGSKSALAEGSTDTGSTVSVLNVQPGEGANKFAVGQSVLVKDLPNGYSLRPISSIATDALSLGFDLSNAPASGVSLGQSIHYEAADSGHPTFTQWIYWANQGALEAQSGSKVTELSLEIPAGDLLNASFSFQSTKAFYNPVIVTAPDTAINFVDDGGAKSTSLAAGVYRDPYEAAAALKSAMDGSSVNDITVSWNNTGANAGKFTIASDGTTFELTTTAANSVFAAFGFDTGVDETGATSYNSDNEKSYASAFTPSFDAATPLVGKNTELLLGDSSNNICVEAASVSVSGTNLTVDDLSLCAESGRNGVVFIGREFEITIDATLTKHQAEYFKKFRANESVPFFYAFGTKSGGNWEPGKCGTLYAPKCSVTTHSLGDRDGLVALNLTLQPYVESGASEFHINFL